MAHSLRFMSTPVILLGLVTLLAGLSFAKSTPKPLLTLEIPGGRLMLMWGMGHQSYWPTGNEGAVRKQMEKGWFRAREYMTQNDGDWCLFFLALEGGAGLTIDQGTSLTVALADGAQAKSDMVLAVDGPRELRFWNSLETPLGFEPGCLFGRTAKTGAYPLYVRFPAGSCLTSKGDEVQREFKSKPVSIRLTRGGE